MPRILLSSVFKPFGVDNLYSRLTYTPIESETVNTKFEMSQDGEKFIIYIEGKSKKHDL